MITPNRAVDIQTQPTTNDASVDDESDMTPSWVPLAVVIIAVPFMLILFVLIGYWVLN